jgi:hypothetical protein
VANAPNPRLSMIYRVYLPGDVGDPDGEWGLPELALESASGEELFRFGACGPFTRSDGIPAAGALNATIRESGFPDELALAPFVVAPNEPRFVKFYGLPETGRSLANNVIANLTGTENALPPSALTAGGGGGFLSNTHNNYLAATFSRERGNLYVVRAKAPTFPGDPRSADGELRYWSFCVNELGSQRYVACSTDYQTRLDEQGFFTFVVSDPEDRPANVPRPDGTCAASTCATDVTWLPWGGVYYDSLVIYRHMLPSAGFTQAIQHVPYWKDANPETGELADPAASMGEYFPRGVYCSTATVKSAAASGQAIFGSCDGD